MESAGVVTILSEFLPLLFQNLSSLIEELLQLTHGFEEKLKHLDTTLSMIKAVLQDAEERQHEVHAVRLWLNELRDIAYDANDLLDEFVTEARRRQSIPYLRRLRNSPLISKANPRRILFEADINLKIEEINERLDIVQKQRHAFGLEIGSRARGRDAGSELSQSTSLIPSTVLDRRKDKARIIELLVPSDVRMIENGVWVIPIVGMAGLGKTTLAQLVYNDAIVERHFELRMWVYVSHDFNVNKLTKAIIASVDSSFVYDHRSLDILQKHLRKKLSGRRFLLVLDYVWNENPREWDKFIAPLLSGAKGSRILVTTRSEGAAASMSTSITYQLQGLSSDDCWSLFCQYASLGEIGYSDLLSIKKAVVDKCKGLPLAATALGFRLRRETDKTKWRTILQNEEFSDISHAISFSYQHLPTNVKPCFVYCAVFPKGFEFEKEALVQLWMAQNLIQPKAGEQLEDTGSHYFDTLVQRSFFQYSHFDHKKDLPKYIMHDHIHEFAENLSKKECRFLDDLNRFDISEKARHLTFVCESFVKEDSRHNKTSMLEKIYACKGLYTLLITGGPIFDVPKDLAENLDRLRGLDLNNSGLTQLPKSIGDLKHLRYLQLSNNGIKKLPNSVSDLLNLQVLGLRNCSMLEELPKGTRNLLRLRCLDLRCTSLKSMPPEIGLLTNLQELPRFVVGRKKESRLKQLKNLNNLHGELFISNLHLAQNAAEATEANLASKQCLRLLQLQWNDDYENASTSSLTHEQVLRELQPHPNLKELRIVGYKGVSLPSWDAHSFTHLITLRLSNCKHCELLPPLGRLPLLKHLSIEGMYSLQVVDCAFCGGSRNPFPSLEKLHFENMPRLQVWWGVEGCSLPSLRELTFRGCTDLRQLTHSLPSLTRLKIEGSPHFLGLPKIPSLGCLDVSASRDWILGSMNSVTSVSYLSISGLQTDTLPDNLLPTGLTYLAVKHCPQLHALPAELHSLRLMEDLEIQDCPQLSFLPDGITGMKSMVRLEISDCPMLRSWPSNGLPTTLQFLSISNCSMLTQRCRLKGTQEWQKIAHIFSVWIDGEMVSSNQA